MEADNKDLHMEKNNKYGRIIDKVQAVRQAVPPSDFTEKVMKSLSVKQKSVLYELLSQKRGFSPSLNDKNSLISALACFFYYFIAGLFYFIIGIVSITGFRKTDIVQEPMNWMVLQPYLSTLIGLWFFLLGVVLLLNGNVGTRLAKSGTILYIFFAVINCLLIRPYLHIPYAMIFIAVLAATSSLMGIMLILAVHKMELRFS
jgi:hypothetical protein